MSEKEERGHRAGWCIHYQSYPRVRSEVQTCKAGVRYVDFNDGKTEAMYRAMPCFLDKKTHTPSNAGAKPCEKLRPPTPEEVGAHEAWFKAHMNKMVVVMTTIEPMVSPSIRRGVTVTSTSMSRPSACLRRISYV